MKPPANSKTEIYPVNDTEYGVVTVTDSGKFWVAVRRTEKLLPGEKFRIMIKDDDSFEFDNFEEVKEYLLEKADEAYKAQFTE